MAAAHQVLCVVACFIFSTGEEVAAEAKHSIVRKVFDEQSDALPPLERRSTILDRMQYWRTAGPALPPTSRYLIFTNDPGGPNNLRVGWEMTGVVAQHTNRTLVLPPGEQVYLLDGGPKYRRNFDGSTRTKVEDLINLVQLAAYLPTLTWDEFHQRTGMTFKEAQGKAGFLEGGKTKNKPCHSLTEWDNVTEDILYMDGAKDRQGFVCGEWNKLGGPVESMESLMTEANWVLLRHGFVWHSDAFSIASKVVDYLGLFEYNALHGRYGDLQYQDVKTEPVQIFKNWPLLLEGVKTLYIASDSPEKFENISPRNADGEDVRLIRWADLFTEKTGNLLQSEKAKYTEERWFKLSGPVEELICTYSKLFVGTRLSSFSGHINRMRIHAQAPVQGVHVHGIPDQKDDIPQMIEVWKRAETMKTHKTRDSNKGDVFFEISSDGTLSPF